MVFMLSAGSLLVPSILGSTTSQWFTQTIDQWFKDALDWNTASAYAFILLSCAPSSSPWRCGCSR
jgi:spermidine/putrescine transport system permease protein